MIFIFDIDLIYNYDNILYQYYNQRCVKSHQIRLGFRKNLLPNFVTVIFACVKYSFNFSPSTQIAYKDNNKQEWQEQQRATLQNQLF